MNFESFDVFAVPGRRRDLACGTGACACSSATYLATTVKSIGEQGELQEGRPETMSLERGAWRKHKNYPEQTLLLGSHENFRQFSAILLEGAREQFDREPHGPPVMTQLHLFRRWKSAMHSHERYEEGKLYPYLRARFGVSTDSLETQHEELAEAELRVHSAFDASSATEVVDAFEAHERELFVHLAEEEHLVIPLLLSLTRREFYDFTQNSIGRLLRTLDQIREPKVGDISTG